jgi:hypothetical protein
MSFLCLENIKLQSKEFEQTKFITNFMYNYLFYYIKDLIRY